MNRSVPHLNVNSLSMVHLSHLPLGVHGRELKDAISKEIGSEITFVETFEAWFGRRIGHMVIEFRYSKALKLFLNEFDSFKRRYFKEPPKVEGILIREGGRAHFFETIQRLTGVDLLKTDGEPPERWFTEKRSLESRYRQQRFTPHHHSTTRQGGYTSARPQSHLRPEDNSNDSDPLREASAKLSRLLLGDGGGSAQKNRDGERTKEQKEEDEGVFLVVENLPPGCSREELKSVFGMPPPLSVEVLTPLGDDSTLMGASAKQANAVGYLRYVDAQKAELAVVYAGDAQLRGRQLKFRIKQPRAKEGVNGPTGDAGLASKSDEKEGAGGGREPGKKSSHPPIRYPFDDDDEEMPQFTPRQ